MAQFDLWTWIFTASTLILSNIFFFLFIYLVEFKSLLDLSFLRFQLKQKLSPNWFLNFIN